MELKTNENAQKPFLILTMVVCIVLIFVVIFVLFRISRRSQLRQYIRNDVEMELGTDLSVNAFLTEEMDKAYIDMNFDLFDSVGDYKVKLKLKGETFYSNLHVVDTTSPFLTVRNLTIYDDEELPLVTDFIERISELSDYTIDPVEIVRQEGEQVIHVCARDISGNVSAKDAILTIKPYEEGPIFRGVDPIVIELGQSIDVASGVTATTRNLENVSFAVNDSRVNYSKAGSYEIYYTAQDSFGNKTTVTRSITIQKKEKTYQISNFSTSSMTESIRDSAILSFYDVLKFYGVDVSLEQIVSDLQKGASLRLENQKLYGANPDEEYVGDPNSSTSYGVYQGPLFQIASNYKEGIIDSTGYSMDAVLALVRKGIPVQVWVTKDLDTPNQCVSWNAQNRNIDWYCNMESVVIVGYNSSNILVSSPYSSEIKEYSRSQFEEIYNFLGKRALYYEN